MLILNFNNIYSQCIGSECYLFVNQTGTCIGDSVEIEAKTNGKFIGWTTQDKSTNGISSPSSLKTTVISNATSSSFIAYSEILSPNMVVNGDFEQGKIGFSSDYNYTDTVFKTGDYSIGKNPKLTAKSKYSNQRDHTSGGGNMLIADGNADSTKAIYRTTVSVASGKEYVFTVWVANVHSEFAKLIPDTTKNKTAVFEIHIDGKLVGIYKTPLDTVWHQIYYKFNAIASKNITIEIKDRITINTGNDLAIDDVYFGGIQTIESTVGTTPCGQILKEEFTKNAISVFSPDGDGIYDTYCIEMQGKAKVIDLGGTVIFEQNAPICWDGTKKNGALADAGYYVIVVNNNTIFRVSLVR